MSEFDKEEPVPTTVTADLVQLDQVFDDARAKRNAVIDLLTPFVEKIQIDKTKPREVEVQMQMLNTYLSAINANETGISRRVSSKLKQIETNSANKHSEAVAELLSRIEVGKVSVGDVVKQPDEAQISARLESSFTEHNLSPVLDTELRVDPKDVDC